MLLRASTGAFRGFIIIIFFFRVLSFSFSFWWLFCRCSGDFISPFFVAFTGFLFHFVDIYEHKLTRSLR